MAERESVQSVGDSPVGIDGEHGRIEAACAVFRDTGVIPQGIVRDVIAASWERSRKFGVDPYMKTLACVVPEEEKRQRMESARRLVEVAHPFIVNLYESIKGMEVAVGLLDGDGFGLEIHSEGVVKTLMDEAGLVQGSHMNEESIGTTAPGIVMKSRKPQRVVAQEHWVCRAKISTTVAAPILGPEDKLEGIIAIAAFFDLVENHPHTYGMTLAAANAIEAQMRLRTTADELYRSNKYLVATVKSISDGLILLDRKMKVIQLNQYASELTCLEEGKMLSVAMNNNNVFRRVEGITVSHTGFWGQEAVFINSEGEDQRVLLDAQPISDEDGDFLGVVLVLREMKRMRNLAHRIYGARALYTFDDIIGEDPQLKECISVLKTASRSDFPIVIMGESGTGKEMFAHAIHNHSHRRNGPFIPLNCAAIPKDLLESELFGYDEGAFTGAKRGGNPGKFELADGGTIFLDEVDSMPRDMQAKLLRLIEEKRGLRLGGKDFIPVDVRIISASNKDLQVRIREGAFRDDLYFRLNVVGVNLPPLRVRPGDIPILAEHFINKYTRSTGEADRFLKPEILETLQAYEWPGNARELSNWVERLLALGKDGGIGRDRLVPSAGSGPLDHETSESEGNGNLTLDESEARYMKEVITAAIARNHGVLSKAALALNISRTTLYRRMLKYGIEGKKQ